VTMDHHCSCRRGPSPISGGLIGMAGAALQLTAATLFGGVRMLRTTLEGAAWGGCSESVHHCGCRHDVVHCYHVTCVPHTSACGCGCCR
jgi:hypothetical protein